MIVAAYHLNLATVNPSQHTSAFRQPVGKFPRSMVVAAYHNKNQRVSSECHATLWPLAKRALRVHISPVQQLQNSK